MGNIIKDIMPATERADFARTDDPQEAVAQVRTGSSLRDSHGNTRSDA